jgi:hypothetical protein
MNLLFRPVLHSSGWCTGIPRGRLGFEARIIHGGREGVLYYTAYSKVISGLILQPDDAKPNNYELMKRSEAQ